MPLRRITGQRPSPVIDCKRLLAVVLGNGVGGTRLDRCRLVVHAERQTVVERAGGGEDEALDPALDAGAVPWLSVATAFICQLASGSYSAVGSFERPDRLITASTPSKAAAGMSRTSAWIVSTSPADGRGGLEQDLLVPPEQVEHPHPVTTPEQLRDQSGADVARPSGDQNLHVPVQERASRGRWASDRRVHRRVSGPERQLILDFAEQRQPRSPGPRAINSRPSGQAIPTSGSS